MSKFLTNSIVVAAQGYSNQWNIVKEKTKAPDLEFMQKLIPEIAQIQQADMDDVTVIGTSNGAGMISRMLIEMENPLSMIKRVIPMVSHLTVYQYHDGSFWMPSNDDNGEVNNFDQGRKLLSCSQVKSWVKELTWLLISSLISGSQSEARLTL